MIRTDWLHEEPTTDFEEPTTAIPPSAQEDRNIKLLTPSESSIVTDLGDPSGSHEKAAEIAADLSSIFLYAEGEVTIILQNLPTARPAGSLTQRVIPSSVVGQSVRNGDLVGPLGFQYIFGDRVIFRYGNIHYDLKGNIRVYNTATGCVIEAENIQIAFDSMLISPPNEELAV